MWKKRTMKQKKLRREPKFKKIIFEIFSYFSIRLLGHSGSSKKSTTQAVEPAVAPTFPNNPKIAANTFAIIIPPSILFKHCCLNHNFYNSYKEAHKLYK